MVYGGDTCGEQNLPIELTVGKRTLTGKLRDEKDNLEKRLKEINVVLAKLEAQPELQDLLDSIHKLNLRY